MSEFLYPVHSLNTNITAFLKKVISADILGCVKTGLKNDVNLMDKGSHITKTLCIERCEDGISSQVYLSSAYCQYFWLLCDIVLRILDRRVIASACTYYGITLDAFMQNVKDTNMRKREQVLPFVPDYLKPDIDRYLTYLKIVPDLLTTDFWEQLGKKYEMAECLRDRRLLIDKKDMNTIDMKGKYAERTNSVYCYGIAFCMLHELAHHKLKHLDKEEEMKDEIDADARAFWNIYKDIKGEERFSANIGMLLVFFSFMMLNPKMEEDGIHPREDKRMFTIYDIVENENPKYTMLLVNMLDLWAKLCQIDNYPKNLEPIGESIVKIKKYFGILD